MCRSLGLYKSANTEIAWTKYQGIESLRILWSRTFPRGFKTCWNCKDLVSGEMLFSHVTWWLLWSDKHWSANQPADCSNTPRQSPAFQKSGVGIHGSVSLMFTKIKETEQGRHRIPTPLFFFVSRVTHDASACEKPSHLPGVWASSNSSARCASGSD